MAVFLDTGFFLALKNKDDKHHATAREWMRRFLKNEFGKIYTSTFIFDEVTTLALVRLKNKNLALLLGNYISSSPRIFVVHFESGDFKPSWDLFQRYIEKRLSFTDCTILVHVDRLQCRLLATFDSHFKGLVPTIQSA